jgi:aspartyl-tRNA(Asn)/glutamyl-tRNA(Gln) amidotransferase subunit C
MSIDKDKIKHTAKLARISLDEKKIDNLSKDLSNIFKFIEKLNEANTENVKPLSSILDHSLRSREDKVNDGNIRDQILENAPNKNEDFFIVPKVIE